MKEQPTPFFFPSPGRPLGESGSLFVFASLKRGQNLGWTPVEETLRGFCVLLVTFFAFYGRRRAIILTSLAATKENKNTRLLLLC